QPNGVCQRIIERPVTTHSLLRVANSLRQRPKIGSAWSILSVALSAVLKEPDMSWLWMAISRLLSLFGRSRQDKELDEEMRAHIDMLEEEYVRRGMNPREAQRAARRSFGGIDQTKESYRTQRGLPMFETIVQDLRYAFRVLVKNAGF